MTFFRSLKWNLFAAIITIMACCLGLISFLNYCNFEKDLYSFVRSRFLVVSRDLKNTVEYGLNLGLGLSELKNIQQLVVETRERDTDIADLMVLDQQGTILFHSDPTRVGRQAEAGWLQQGLLDRNTPALHTGNQVVQQTILPLVNQFNIMVGSLVLSYPNSVIQQPEKAMLTFLMRRFVIIFSIFSLLTMLLVFTLSNRLLAGINELADKLEQLTRGRSGAERLARDSDFAVAYSNLIATWRQLQTKKEL
jgi:sensor histidine kinase regulating citrate/malate metabolism